MNIQFCVTHPRPLFHLGGGGGGCGEGTVTRKLCQRPPQRCLDKTNQSAGKGII